MKKAILGILALTLIGCEKNPLLGEWEAKPSGEAMFALAINEKWRFEENKVIFNGIATDVNYDIKGNRIIVEGKTPESLILGINNVFYIVDKNTIKKTSMFGQEIYYNRTAWPD